MLWLVLPLAAEVATSRLQLTLDTSFFVESYATSTTPANNAPGGNFGGAFEIFFHPLRDDDAPYALQPFLQRASTFTVSGSGGGTSFPRGKREVGDLNLAIDGYLHRNVALFAEFGFTTDQDTGHPRSWTLPVRVTKPLRCLLKNRSASTTPAAPPSIAYGLSRRRARSASGSSTG